MNIRKLLDKLFLFLSATTINLCPESALEIGLEYMPEPIKNLR